MAAAQWDPAGVVARASELIQASNYEKVAEARAGVDAEIERRAGEALALPEGSGERALAAARVAEAWGRYARLEIGLRQFKQATKVFESAVACAVTRDATALWLEYAAFCVDRKKLSNARKVFARAVHAVPEAEREQVWLKFHAFVREHIDPDMALETLQAQMQAALPGAPPTRAGSAILTADQAANESADASAVGDEASGGAVPSVAGPTAAIPPPSVAVEGAHEPAETPAVAGDSAASVAQASSTDSSDVAAAAVGETIVEQAGETAEGPVAPPAVAVDVSVDADQSAPAEKEAKKAEESPELVVDGDSALAFVDKTGQEPVPPELVKPVDLDPSSSKRAGPAEGANDSGASKRAKLDAETSPSAPAGDKAEPLEEPEGFLLQVPKTLPPIDACPFLLFDPPTNEDGAINKAAASELPNELVERLSDVLSDSAVFQGVRDLCTNQEQRDRDMLHRWQELVRMQMKERSVLYGRQAGAEEQLGAEDTRGQIALKMKHLEERHEFVARCLTSQKQFLEICTMDRTSALRAQQISLENMKIPEITVTTDPARIDQQRAIVSVILEAEKLWREDRDAAAAAAEASTKIEPGTEPGEISATSSSQPFEKRHPGRDSLDSASSHSPGIRSSGYSRGGYSRDTSTRGGRGGFRRDGGRGGSWDGGRAGGRGGFRRDDSRPYAGRGGTDRFRRDPRRDPRKPFYENNRDAVPAARAGAPAFDANSSVGAPARFEPLQRAPRLQEEYDPYAPQFHRQQEPPPYYQGQQPPPQQQMPPAPVHYAPTPGSYDAYGRRRDTLPPPGAPYAPQAPAPSAFAAPERYPQDPRRPRANDRYAGPAQAANGLTDWQRPGPHPSPYRQEQQPYRRREPFPTSDRIVEYSIGGMPEGEYRPPQHDPHLPRYGGGLPPAAGRAPPAPYASQAPPPHQQQQQQQQQQRGFPGSQDRGPGPSSSHPPPYDGYAAYDYAPPPQQQQQSVHGGRGAAAFDGPRGFGNGRGVFVPQQQQQQQRELYPQYEQPPPESFGYEAAGPRSHGRGYGRGRGGGRRGGGPRPFRR